jgi:hypothetical protein
MKFLKKHNPKVPPLSSIKEENSFQFTPYFYTESGDDFSGICFPQNFSYFFSGLCIAPRMLSIRSAEKRASLSGNHAPCLTETYF